MDAPHPCDALPLFAPHPFTGKERDTESGLDYFGARYYAGNMGRWMSPDWSPTPASIPYGSLGNPQSLNLYRYVANNPLVGTDLDGHRYGAQVPSNLMISQYDNLLRVQDGNTAQLIAEMLEEEQTKQTAQAQQTTARVHGRTVTYRYADGTSVTLRGTHPFRDNNPGDTTGGPGAIGHDGGFTIYATAQDGWDALSNNLAKNYSDKTIADAIMKYDPPDDGKNPMLKGNDPVSYAQNLAAMIGVPVTTNLSALSDAQMNTLKAGIGQLEGYNASGNTRISMSIIP